MLAVAKWMGLSVFVAGCFALAVEWHRAAVPSHDAVAVAVETQLGHAPGGSDDRLREAALHWSLTDPKRAITVGAWRYRLQLSGERDPDERLVLSFLSFEENAHFEEGWPNGVLFEWELLARPDTPLARVRYRR